MRLPTVWYIASSLPYIAGSLTYIAGSLPYIASSLAYIAGSLSYIAGSLAYIAGILIFIAGSLAYIAGSLYYIAGSHAYIAGSLSYILGDLILPAVPLYCRQLPYITGSWYVMEEPLTLKVGEELDFFKTPQPRLLISCRQYRLQNKLPVTGLLDTLKCILATLGMSWGGNFQD